MKHKLLVLYIFIVSFLTLSCKADLKSKLLGKWEDRGNTLEFLQNDDVLWKSSKEGRGYNLVCQYVVINENRLKIDCPPQEEVPRVIMILELNESKDSENNVTQILVIEGKISQYRKQKEAN